MNILILSPHIDDEVLGAFSYLTATTTILYFGFDESHLDSEWIKLRPSKETRLGELENVAKKIGFKYKILNHKINHYNSRDLIADIEHIINNIRPELVLIPNPTYNQDHREVYEAALVALRPHDINHFVKKVLIYEQLQDLWNHNYHTFSANHYNKVNLPQKLKTYKIYESQVRNFRSTEMIESLALLRGSQSNYKYAEAFEIIRWIV
jgi:N-acetylglucosamine malate deacetylase 1